MDIYLFYGLDVLAVMFVGVEVKYVFFGVGIEFSYFYECIYIDLVVVIECMVDVYFKSNLVN